PAPAPAPAAFSGFSGFVAPKPAEDKDANKSNSNTSAFAANTDTSSKGSGLFKGFSFGQPASGGKPGFGSASSNDNSKSVSSASKGGSSAAGFTMPAFKFPTTAAPPATSSVMFSGSPKKPTFSSGFVPPGGGGSAAAPSTTKSASVAATTIASPPDASSALSGDKQSKDEEALYKNIRGLNISLQKKISDAIDTNAFVDLTPLLKQYNNHWQKITDGQSVETETTGLNNTGSSKSQNPDDVASKPVALAAAAAQSWGQSQTSVKPTFGFGGASSTPLDTKSSTAETIKVSDTTSPVRSSMFASLEKPKSKSSDSASSQTASTTKPMAFTFGSSNNNNNNSTSSPSAASVPAFAATSAATSAASPAGFSFNFGKSTSGDTKDGEEAKKPFSFGFNKSPGFSANSTLNTSSISSGDSAKPAFSFGFGSGITNNLSASPSANGAGAQTKDANDDDDHDEEEDREDEDGGKKEPTTAGEEGETTEHTVRAKLYMWDSDSKQYKDLGIGNFKVNTWTVDSSGKRGRVLCRQEGSDKITLNAAMFKEMQVENTNGKKEVGILVVNDGKPTRFLIRVKNAESARNLYNAIEKVK
ncbi:hypothetical protein J3B02_004808, partial [Coemansia erecta]